LTAARVLAERFELHEVAGSGGMGTVWRARDASSGDVVAVKLLHVEDDVRVSRFDREARLMAGLSHPGLPRYVAHGTTAGGERYLVMEWLEGVDLGQRLAAAGPLPLDACLTLLSRAAEALGVAHASGVVHRDVKPSNLFLPDGDPGRVKVLDFGVARWQRGGHDHTRAGHRVGTPRYMAPEQARGARDVDARADVFALGCVLFACLTGRAAFTGDEEMAVLAKILLEEAPRVSQLVPSIPPEVDALVAAMMAKDPHRRPRDGAAVAQEVAALRRGEGRARAASPSLSPGEKRLLSVVIAWAGPVVDRTTPGTAPGGTPVPDEDGLTVPGAAPGGVLRDLSEIAWRHGGQVERLADGTVVATVSGNGTATDQAARAARMALAMRAVVPDAPMALATGRGEVAPLPVGEVIERAAALLQAAAPGALRIDDVTAGLLDASFDVGGPPGGRALHGVADGATRTLLGRPTPLVGRDPEMRTLEAVLEECVGEPVASAVLLTAGPGVGKSRLLAELLRRAAARAGPLEIWSAHGDPLRAGSAFGLLGQVLRRAAGIVESDPPALRQAKLRERVARHVAAGSVARVTAFLGEVVGAPADGGPEVVAARDDALLMGDQIRRAWEELVSAECAARPVLLLLDDLQWGDVPSVRLCDAALRSAADRPFMVVAAGRPETLDLFPKLWEGRKLTRIELGGLTRRAAERLAREMLPPDTPDARVAALVEHAAGNAYFLEELIRHADRGDEDLPPTVLAMAQARLEALPAEARRVLRAASVFGRVFWAGGVAALLGESAGDRLEALAARELIVVRPEPRFSGETELAFASELLRAAALRTLTDADLTLGHRLAAEWLLARGETDAMALAEHLDRGGEPARAVAWFVDAAEEALRGNDLQAVLARVERGVAAGASGEALGRLASAAAEVHVWRGELAAAESWIERALASLPRGTPRWFLAAGQAVVCQSRLGHLDRLEAVALLLLERAEPERAWAIAAARAAAQLYFAGRYPAGGTLLARVEELAAAVIENDPAVAAAVHRARAMSALVAGDPAAGLRHWPAAIDAYERAGDRRAALQARGNLANRYKELGGYDQAAALLDEVLATADRLGLITVATLAKHNLGMVLACRGQARRGRIWEEEAIRELMAQGDKRLEASSRAYLATMLLALGERDAAEVEAEMAVRLSGASPPVRALALASLARARLARGAVAEALPEVREAMAILGRLGGLPEGETFVRLVHAQALAAAGSLEDARAAAAEARARLLAMAGKIADPVWRESFLVEVPDNRDTMALVTD
jgi:tetratricopeptide (TPR) repeat protein